MIEVKRVGDGDPMEFEVTVSEGGGQSSHRVTFAADHQARICGQASPEACLEAAFRFLLDREPKEAILGTFDVSVIAKYFPDFERKVGAYL
ncbi:hypothetical protein AN478_08100 [Thiohalorhabdus denitrificans]|uniref:Uncharacterized protein n=1 Tax=Thiohalorhabdus denitrificans TaxID=381306 RepID=A0A0P9GJ54_9GAMM|nr:hypothetical protein [Thiohalorhabdus denitrificans]KPV40104.1 hypothetical protein AN478_08100 [Thiohalorhabdus denitrificans]SCY15866.1 hypothetical protein SAMN05661077_1387 [Thiohalorhabdus denitrificans]